MTDEQREALQALINECYATAKAHGFWESDNIPEKLALIHSEISEALEDYRDAPTLLATAGWELNELFYVGDDGDFTSYPHPLGDNNRLDESSLNKPCGFPSELADIIIRVFDLAAHLKVNLPEAVARKMAYNKTRPYRHGGKSC